MPFVAIDPSTGVTLRSQPEHSPSTMSAIVEDAALAQAAWARQSVSDRAEVLSAIGAALRLHAQEGAALMAEEMGKPLRQGAGEVTKCASVCDYYAESAERDLADTPVATRARTSYVTYAPLGVVLGVMPWNFPYWQVTRFAIPALAAGNAVLVKHAPSVPGCAATIERLFLDAGLPDGLFRMLFIDEPAVATLLEHPAIASVTLTGSTRAGRAVAAAAGTALKRCVLELGGSDPYIVLADADLDLAAEACVKGRFLNTGQSCIAAKRWIVEDAVREAFTERVLTKLRAPQVGDPRHDTSDLGPMARVDLRDQLHDQVRRSIEAGATCAMGGTVPSQPGAWYPVTLLTNVGRGMPAYAEELFGPVAAILAASNEADAIRIANDTPYGLAAAVFSRDVERAESIARTQLHTGGAFVNTFARSDPRLPFGGIKASGWGRELAREGLMEHVNIKTIYVR